jgi:hypothetical protein
MDGEIEGEPDDIDGLETIEPDETDVDAEVDVEAVDGG